MDTDGYWHIKRRQAVFSNTNRDLIDGVYELVVSLGGKANIFKVPPNKFTRHQAWSVIFVPHHFNPFLLERKGGDVRDESQQSGSRTIRSIERVASVPTQCIQVNSSNSLYLAGRQMVPTHNTGKVPQDRYKDTAILPSKIYALLGERVLGERPKRIRLLYVQFGKTITVTVTDADIAYAEMRVRDAYRKIMGWYDAGHFPPIRNNLCENWCAFKHICPIFSHVDEDDF